MVEQISLFTASEMKCDYYHKPFQDGGRYHIETSQWTGFYMITASVLKGLN